MSEDKSLAEKAATTQPGSSGTAAATPNTIASSATPQSGSPVAPAQTSPGQSDLRTRLIPVAIIGLAVVLFIAIFACWSSWQNGLFLDTDDAYVRADVVPLSTRERGIVSKTFVHDYQKVVAGQLLVELKNEDFRDHVQETEQSISQVEIKIDDMKARKMKLDAQIDDAAALLENSRASLQQFDSTIAIAKTAIEEAQANVEASAAVVKQADAAIQSAIADTVKTAASRKREEALLAEESSTKEKVEQVTDEHARSEATLEGQQSTRLKARAEWISKKSVLQKARQQLTSVLIDQKKAESTVKSKAAELVERQMERKLLDGEERQLRTELASKNYSSDSARVSLGYTSIKAPVDGTVGELKVKPGQFVNAGTEVIALVSSSPWVIANFRETQTTKIKVGDKATMTIDALPGRHWRGSVESLAPASGAQFSLLPPDNASGNFTKITQRIPVKITFDDKDSGATNFAEVRPGMSVHVSITH